MGWLLRISLDQQIGLDEQDELQSTLWDLGTTGIAETPAGELIAGFETKAEASQALLTLDQRLRQMASIEAVNPEAWSTTPRDTDIMLGPVAFTMEVGAAFGHGQHPTTRLANDLLTNELIGRELLSRELSRRGEGIRVLDFGTGTGVLALNSLAAGATTVIAIDNDPVALAIAKGNLDRAVAALGLGPEVSITVGPTLPVVAVPAFNVPAFDVAAFDVAAFDVAAFDVAAFDVIVANVLLVVHRQVAAQLAAVAKPGTVLIISGIVGDQRDELVALYPGFAVEDDIADGDWLALRLRAMVI